MGYVEGDDGLFVNTYKLDTPTTEQFAELGMTIKVGVTNNLSEASFCGQVYDVDEKIVVTDVREAVARFGWTNKRYVLASDKVLLQLLRAKGYSFVYQYNGCPILGDLGYHILQLTEGVIIDDKILYGMDQWERSKLRDALNATLPEYKPPGPSTRNLVEKMYGVTVREQMMSEEIIRQSKLGDKLDLPIVFPEEWVSYYDKYHHSFYDRCPLWLNKPETELEERLLKACPQAQAFVTSLRGKRDVQS